MRDQVLDSMELERERGISIKMQPVRIVYKQPTTNNKQLLNSVKESQWAKIHGGRMLLEVRTLSFLQQPTYGSVNIYDLDDCLFSATSWHAREYQLLEENDVLRGQGVHITAQRAKEIYELSKILIPMESVHVNVKAKIVASIRLYPIDEEIEESLINTEVTKCPK